MRNQKMIAGLAVFCLTVAMSTMAFAYDDSDNGYPVNNGYSSRSTAKKHHVVHNAATGENELGFQFGPSIGSANASVKQGTSPNFDSRTRPMFGVTYDHRFMPYLGFRTELNYVQRGFSQTINQGQTSTIIDGAANYLELPLMAKAQYQVGDFTPYFLTGPFVGWLVGNGITTTQGNKPSQDVNADNTTSTFNFGWNFGAGSSYALTKTLKADLGIRYSMAFTNSDAHPVNVGDSTKLNAFQILAGIGFAI